MPAARPGEFYGPYFALFLGLVLAFVGLRFLSKGLDPRPAVVVDSDGLFYRPYGGSIVPWQDIRAVEWSMRGGNGQLILTRWRGPPVIIDMKVLPGLGCNSPVYQAIVQAWEHHGGEA